MAEMMQIHGWMYLLASFEQFKCLCWASKKTRRVCRFSSLSTSFLALYAAGGPSINGSLRSIDVMRNNKCISTIDFYDYLLRGEKSKDVWLQDGDIVFVKPAIKKLGVAGFVLRPAIYELKESETLGDILHIAGA